MRRDTILALGVLALANAMLAQDLAALNVALPSIERDLDVDLTTAQWVVNVYLLIYGVMIVTAGRLADEVGRGRVLLIGTGNFAAMSLLAGTESAQQVVFQFDPAVAQDLLHLAGEAFAAGVRAGLRPDAGIAAVGLLVSSLLLRVARSERHAAAALAPCATR